MSLKTILVGGTALSTVLAGAAVAADLAPAPAYKAPVMAPAPFSWTGFYFGGTVGGGVAVLPTVALETIDAEGPVDGAALKSAAAVAGLHAGYNWQINRSFLFGVEGDFNWAGFKDSVTTCLSTCAVVTNDLFRTSSKLDDFGTLRARFGLTFDRTLVYVTAGPALGRINASFSENNQVTGLPVAQSHDSGFHWGLATGAGVEYALTPNWFLRGEYMHLNFESKDTALTGTLFNAQPIAGNTFASRSSASADIARVGVSYRPWSGPAVDAAPLVKATPPGWSGFYVGGTVGGGVASLPVTDVDAINGDFFTSGPSMKSSAAVAGVHAGYNWQASPSVMVGVEGDFNWAGFSNTTTARLLAGGSECRTTSSKLDNFGTIRARFGLTSDRTLVYVTAGPAYGHIKASEVDFAPPLTANSVAEQSSDSRYHWGTAVGAGVEYALTPNWILRGEYLHLNFGNKDATDVSGGVPLPTFRTRSSAEADIARVGVSYKPWVSAGLPVDAPFNWTGFYVGGSVGGGMASLPVTDMDGLAPNVNGDTLKSTAAVGGLHAGYNWQFAPSALAGIEGDFNWTGLSDSDSTNHGSVSTFVSSSKLDDFGSIRARFGLTSGRTLAYVTAGPVFGHINANYGSAQGTGSTAPDGSFHAGIATGAGVEYALAPNWILRGQYMHLNFENKDVVITHTNGVPITGFTARYSATADIAQIGISYKPW